MGVIKTSHQRPHGAGQPDAAGGWWHRVQAAEAARGSVDQHVEGHNGLGAKTISAIAQPMNLVVGSVVVIGAVVGVTAYIVGLSGDVAKLKDDVQRLEKDVGIQGRSAFGEAVQDKTLGVGQESGVQPQRPQPDVGEHSQSDESESPSSNEVVPSTRSPVERGVALASSLADEGRVDAAIAAWHKVIEMGEDDEYAFDAYLSIAVLESERGRHSEAIDMYDQAIKLKPDMAGAYFNRGTAKNEIGQFEAAIEDFSEAIRIAPFLASAFSNRGFSKSSLGRFEEAISDYDRAIELAPDLSIPYQNRAFANARLGREQAAVADFRKATELDDPLRNLLGEHVGGELEH